MAKKNAEGFSNELLHEQPIDQQFARTADQQRRIKLLHMRKSVHASKLTPDTVLPLMISATTRNVRARRRYPSPYR